MAVAMDETAGGQTLGPELLVDESFLLRVLRDVMQKYILSATDVADCGDQTSEPADDLAGRLETLWDLCVDRRTAAFLVSNKAASILPEVVLRAQATDDTRSAEVCLGVLGNICSHAKVAVALTDGETTPICGAVLGSLNCADGAVVLQALRLACALLTGPLAGKCGGLWSETAITRYLFVLENALLWDAVRHACDVLSQVLVLALQDKLEPDAAGEGGAGPSTRPDAQIIIGRFTQEHLLQSLVSRLDELTAVLAAEVDAAIDVHEGEGDASAAVLSALCLADSFVAAVPSVPTETAGPLVAACIEVLVQLWKPEVLSAALELLASLLDDGAEADCRFAVLSQVQETLSGVAGPRLVERLILVLEDSTVGEAPVAVALTLLRSAPAALLADHRDTLDAASARLQQNPGGVQQEGGEDEEASRGQASRRERSRSPILHRN